MPDIMEIIKGLYNSLAVGEKTAGLRGVFDAIFEAIKVIFKDLFEAEAGITTTEGE